MTYECTSTIAVIWAVRSGGGGTERRYLDFVVDGAALSSLLNCDFISPFGWSVPEEQIKDLDRLLRRAPSDLPKHRVSLYICPECGDLGCGAVSILVERGKGTVTCTEN